MIWAQRGQGPSNPAAAGGTRRVVPHAGQWNWITSAIGKSSARFFCHGSAGVSMSGNRRGSGVEFEDPDACNALRRGEAGDMVREPGVVQWMDPEIP